MSFTSSETIESFSSYCATGLVGKRVQGRAKGEGERGETVCCTTLSATGVCRGVQGAVGGGALLCVCVWCGRGGRKEDRRVRESYPETPGAICHIGMALELPGGPPQQEGFRLSSREKGGA